MVRHTDDNDKKPRARQDERSPRPFKSSGPRKSGDGKTSFGDKPRSPRDDGAKRFGDKPDRGDRPRAGKAGKDGKPASGSAKSDTPLRAERIAKTMARAGIASRREVERLIGLGKVAVNGRILDTPATLVTRDDVITVDGKPIGSTQATRVWRYHKPAGLLTSHRDPTGRPTVFDALPAGLPRVISIGRLDLSTEGLLLLTNDGELSRAMELPSAGLVRQYRARARGKITQEQLDELKNGAVVEGISYGPMVATLDKAKESKSEDGRTPSNLWISVSITEGKNREVRKVLESVGLTVNRLIRLAYGPFRLDVLPVGSVEEIGPRVIRELLADYIRPENLPTGNTVETPAPVPGRRVSTPILKGRTRARPCRTRRASPAASAPPKRPRPMRSSAANVRPRRKAGPRPRPRPAIRNGCSSRARAPRPTANARPAPTSRVRRAIVRPGPSSPAKAPRPEAATDPSASTSRARPAPTAPSGSSNRAASAQPRPAGARRGRPARAAASRPARRAPAVARRGASPARLGAEACGSSPEA
jgi:23S rRNA pseudouridine2605 synthase